MKSDRAKLIKLADKTDNVRRMGSDPPPDWSRQRRLDYVGSARAVVARLRGTNEWLASQFDLVADAAESSLKSASERQIVQRLLGAVRHKWLSSRSKQ